MYDEPPLTVREKVSGILYIIIAKLAGLNTEVTCHCFCVHDGDIMSKYCIIAFYSAMAYVWLLFGKIQTCH